MKNMKNTEKNIENKEINKNIKYMLPKST